jgi:phosphatidylinositol N-acetylglucosaminyltransferase subunit P
MFAVPREWAILIPAWTIVVVLLTYWVYFALALYRTPAFTDISAFAGAFSSVHAFTATMLPCSLPPSSFRLPLSLSPTILILFTLNVDIRAHYPRRDPDHPANISPYTIYADPRTVPELYDVPIGIVSRVLYRRRTKDEVQEEEDKQIG